jgi:hypothetical protein
VGCYYAGPASTNVSAQVEYVRDVRRFYGATADSKPTKFQLHRPKWPVSKGIDMALPAKPFRISIVFALAAAGVTAANAQSLNNPRIPGSSLRRGAVRRARSAKFVFCGRKARTLHQAPVRPASTAACCPRAGHACASSIQPPEELSHAKVGKKKPLKKKRKKPAIQYECKPVSKPK